jgi:GTP-binding protein
VVIVGRPNVGKSTLFNRLTGSRRALVHDLPGVTRDRIVGEARRPGGGVVTVVDTGGLLMEDEDRFIPLIRSQAEAALDTADAIIFLLDGEAGVIPEDRELANYLRARRAAVVPVVNKADRKLAELQAHEFHVLGFGEPVLVSAEHGTGIQDLWEALEVHLPPAAPEAGEGEEEADGGGEARVAIVGRPNVGKSSLLNRLAGEERVLVSEVPGTTRDAVDVVLEVDGARMRFVDTAGIRRKGKTDKGPEVLSVVMARRQLERSHLSLVLLDATRGVTSQDAHVAGYAWESGRGVILVVNKWDLVPDRGSSREKLEAEIGRKLKFLHHAPRVFLSARTGEGVHKLWPLIRQVYAGTVLKATTSELNRVLRQAWERRPPPSKRRKEAKLFYATQVGILPPRFVLFTNLASAPHFSYVRHMENVLRDAFGLAGVPIRVMIRGREH